MANSKGTSYFYAIFGITLVLFVVGVAAILVYEAHRISTSVKENVNVEVVLKDSVGMARVASLQSYIQAKPYTKATRYVSKEEAAKTLQQDLGENFLDILGYNPLYGSYMINLYEPYANKDSFAIIKTDLLKYAEVKQVNVQSNVLESLDHPFFFEVGHPCGILLKSLLEQAEGPLEVLKPLLPANSISHPETPAVMFSWYHIRTLRMRQQLWSSRMCIRRV